MALATGAPPPDSARTAANDQPPENEIEKRPRNEHVEPWSIVLRPVFAPDPAPCLMRGGRRRLKRYLYSAVVNSSVGKWLRVNPSITRRT